MVSPTPELEVSEMLGRRLSPVDVLNSKKRQEQFNIGCVGLLGADRQTLERRGSEKLKDVDIRSAISHEKERLVRANAELSLALGYVRIIRQQLGVNRVRPLRRLRPTQSPPRAFDVLLHSNKRCHNTPTF